MVPLSLQFFHLREFSSSGRGLYREEKSGMGRGCRAEGHGLLIGCILCFGRLEAGGFVVDWFRVKAMDGGDGVG